MNVLFLTQGVTIPSARFRVAQFVPHFEAAGVRCTVRPGYGRRYNWLAPTPVGTVYRGSHRAVQLLRSLDVGRFSVVFIQRPILPLSPLPEEILTRLNPRTIFDVDDAIWLGQGGSADPARLRTFRRNVALCRHLICGNDFLAAEAAAPRKTTVLPTVLDTDLVAPGPRRTQGPLRVGWMGTASNFPYLDEILGPIRSLLDKRPNVRFRVVANRIYEPLRGHKQVEQIAWSEQGEIALLQSLDIGVMPLITSLAALGKCALKMLQYMAVGIPIVASPIGANVDVLQGARAGFLAEGPDDWVQRLLQLADDASLRRELGDEGRAHCVSTYSVRAMIPRYLQLLREAASS